LHTSTFMSWAVAPWGGPRVEPLISLLNRHASVPSANAVPQGGIDPEIHRPAAAPETTP